MIVLGICDSQDSGAALFANGRLIAAVNEERLNRQKLWGGFPAQSIAEVLRLANIPAKQVETVVVGTQMTPNVVARARRELHQELRRDSGQFGYLLSLFIAYQAVARRVRIIGAAETAVARTLFARELRAIGIRCRIAMVEHHSAHAASAWATAPFDRALVVTLDGLGDGLAVTVSAGERGKKLQRVHVESGFSAETLYYSRLTQYLGFQPIRDEGKVNGLAAYTQETPALGIARQLLHSEDGHFNTQNHLVPSSPESWPFSELKRFTREQVAASFQKNLEDQVCAFLRHWLAKTGTRHVAGAGGAFANVKLNQRIAEMPEVLGLHVFPHMGDGGLAVGGCLAFLEQDPEPLPDAFLGGAPMPGEIAKLLAGSGLPHRKCPDIAAETARLLAEGHIVARCDGRMEYGPRALGNRSILSPAHPPEIIDRLNEHLKRSAFMPFAPAVHEADFDACFTGGNKARQAARFMTVSFDATPLMKEKCPAAVHVDGTCRPQLVAEASNPGFARILREYKRLTGIPTVINTSFNMHEEPIVYTAADALASWRRSGLRYLTLGEYLVERPEKAA